MADANKMREAADALYRRGYEDAKKERDYDPRESTEWQTVVDLVEQPAQGEAVAWYDGKKFYGSTEAAVCDCADMPSLRPVYYAPPAPSVSAPASTVNELTQDDFTTVLEFQAYRSGFKAGKASQPAQGEAAAAGPRFTYGHCADRRQVGGCTRHNLYCGYPDCDRKEVPRG